MFETESPQNRDHSDVVSDVAEDVLETNLADEKIEPSLEDQLSQMRDNWLRALADAENLRKRFQKEREEVQKYGAVSFARDVVTIIDDLERALSTCQERDSLPEGVKSVLTGVEMIAKEIRTAFERHHVKKIEALGMRFDPNLHQAMFEMESADQEPGIILQVLQEGYVMHDRLLRPAMVGVSKKALVS